MIRNMEVSILVPCPSGSFQNIFVHTFVWLFVDAEGASSSSNFLMYFCGSKQHPCSSDVDFDSRWEYAKLNTDTYVLLHG